ncbi:hypothetical protein BDV95DRAFT_587953 [Massariosphaeria phaeospora]|uniref:Secreted protein n=1 Tax=Massariosphaeria phaeospora TaxID=100035 RepID=A0A7C8M1A0_9PLEO|nr:hypothetical protein BDV95DRAFT_587953 [Massariosphaeria phaeospora]
MPTMSSTIIVLRVVVSIARDAGLSMPLDVAMPMTCGFESRTPESGIVGRPLTCLATGVFVKAKPRDGSLPDVAVFMS